MKSIKLIFSWIFEFLTNLYWFIKTIGVNPLDYPTLVKQRTTSEWQEEWNQLEQEIQEFKKEIGNRMPCQWSFGEIAWYESIRRREATL